MKPLLFILLTLTRLGLMAQPEANYDETKVPKFSVPDPLTTFSGEAITTSQEWEEKRKLEIYQFFEKQIYGKVPALLDEYSFKVIEQDNKALGGKAQRKQIAVGLKKNNRTLNFNILLYLPNGNEKAPVFLGYNFHGNHTVTDDPNVIIPEAWNENNADLKISSNKATEASRGVRMNRWTIDKMLDNGYGLATVYYGEIDPDKNDFSDGLHSLFYDEEQTKPKTNEWGSIAAWAYGLSRAMDYLENDTNISNVIVFGHSRLGKAALWAGATDDRFSGVISNNSGCGGAALFKRKFGETIGHINNSFPHWFSASFKKYSNKEEILPVDQHQLLALIAPRPLYIASAVEDEWADPKGEFLSTQYASKVYGLYGKKGIDLTDFPETDRPIQQTMAYHMRSGKHDVTAYDWDQYMSWAETFAK
ncbi:acetylxylan esterase [Zobellia alginiliquefaciens]|uniref:glucuronyl esterase domain-containing protein n=1 Tax=Zobellia alginiliquefaciens TaxID=3032586 RepID=UPI0023E2DB09|nr:acetylxylan esterase [Zobellia alginiliquefaciens]